MKAEEFVEVLRASAPEESRLRDAGLTPGEARELLRAYDCIEREGHGLDSHSDELERLLVGFDCSRAEVGAMTFLAAPRLESRGVVIGHLEAEPIVLVPDGRVLMFDHEGGDEPRALCASSGAHLLDGLAHLVRAGTGHAARSPALCRACATMAGADPSSDFWRTLAE